MNSKSTNYYYGNILCDFSFITISVYFNCLFDLWNLVIGYYFIRLPFLFKVVSKYVLYKISQYGSFILRNILLFYMYTDDLWEHFKQENSLAPCSWWHVIWCQRLDWQVCPIFFRFLTFWLVNDSLQFSIFYATSCWEHAMPIWRKSYEYKIYECKLLHYLILCKAYINCRDLNE